MSEQSQAPGTVTTFGHGTVRGVPDLMRVEISVETQASTVALAYNQAGQRAAAVSASLRSHDVPTVDIATSGLSVRTEKVRVDGGGSKISGYVASTTMTVLLRDIDTGNTSEGSEPQRDPAAIIADCVEVGGDAVRLGGLQLTFADQESLLVRARNAAWANALAKAGQYAERAGRALGAVLEVTEDSSAPGPRPRARTGTVAFTAATVPIETGESEVGTDVRVTWQLD